MEKRNGCGQAATNYLSRGGCHKPRTDERGEIRLVDERQETNKGELEFSHDAQVAAVHQIPSLAGEHILGDEVERARESELLIQHRG